MKRVEMFALILFPLIGLAGLLFLLGELVEVMRAIEEVRP